MGRPARPGSRAAAATPRRGSVEVGEPELDLALGRLVRVGAVDEIERDLDGVVAADRSGSGLERVRRADELPGGRGRVHALEHGGHQGSTRDELDQLTEEGLVSVLLVVAPGELI